MKKGFLLGMVIALIITNIMTLIFWNADEKVVIDNANKKVSEKSSVAKVGNKKISYKEWARAIRENHGKNQLKTLINREVVKQLADANDIKISEKIISREIALLTTMEGVMSKEETRRKEHAWTNDIVYRYRLGFLLTAETRIPEEAIRSHYQKYKDQYNFKASTQLSHIVLPDMETAEKIKEKLDQGESFSSLAKKYSIDEESKQVNGYFGFFVNTSKFLPDAYAKVAAEMDERTYSEPFQVTKGAAIIYLHRKLPSITFRYEEIKPYVKQELAMKKNRQTLNAESLWDKVDVEWVYE